MSRFCHYIKDNKSSETIHECIFLDCETDQVKCGQAEVRHVLRFGWACYQRRDSRLMWRKAEWFKFYTEDELYDWLITKMQRKIKLYVWCHNSNFDYPVLRLFDWLSDVGGKLNMAVLSGPPTIMRYRYRTCTVVLLDTLNIWRMPLEKLGEIVNCRKLPMPTKDDTQDTWDTYGQRDVEIIRRAVTKWADFIMLNDFGGFAPTLAGQSMRLYRHRFLATPIAIHDNERALELERNCYHGGRNECFRIGQFRGNYTLLDVNSMYPFAMHDNHFPIALKHTISNVSIQDIKTYLLSYMVCAKVRLVTSIPAYPFRKDGKLIFPIGEFDAYLCTPELQYAIDHNHIQHCYELALYDRGMIFTDFVDYLYNKRLSAELEDAPTDSYLYKILLNSHYGKWGQGGYNNEYIGEQQDTAWKQFEVIDGMTGKVIKYRQLGHRLEIVKHEGSARDAFPAIAAHVTAYARMYLWRLIEHANPSKVFYCDTDSILCDTVCLDNLASWLDDKRLGGLKIEGHFTDIEIRGCKDYRFGSKSRAKGVKRKAIWITPNSVQQDRWDNLRGLLRQGRLNEPHTKTITKTLHRIYTKGTVDNDGVVRPISLSAMGGC